MDEETALNVALNSGAEVDAPAGRDRLGPLIITIFGLYARGEHNWLSVASVVQLMADLGVEGQAVRSSISRLKRRGVVRTDRRDGAAGYALSEPTLETLAEGDARIFERRRATTEDGWLVVVFSVPESERHLRHTIRSSLRWLGFAALYDGLWCAPWADQDAALAIFSDLGVHTATVMRSEISPRSSVRFRARATSGATVNPIRYIPNSVSPGTHQAKPSVRNAPISSA